MNIRGDSLSRSANLIAFLLISLIIAIQFVPIIHAQDNTTDFIPQANHPDDHADDWYFIIFPITGIVFFIVIIRKIRASTEDKAD